MLQGSINSGPIELTILEAGKKGICEHIICTCDAEFSCSIPRRFQQFIACVQANDLRGGFLGQPLNVEAKTAANIKENVAFPGI